MIIQYFAMEGTYPEHVWTCKGCHVQLQGGKTRIEGCVIPHEPDCPELRSMADDLIAAWLESGIRKTTGYADQYIRLLTKREMGIVIDALMVLMHGIEQVPQNDLSELPEIDRLLKRFMRESPGTNGTDL